MFAAIHVPDFALQCILRREPELRDRAFAVVDGELPARVRQTTAAAHAHGVAAGMTTTQALGRCSSLLFRTAGSLNAESTCLLQCAESFSPWLEATGEGTVTLELRLDPQDRSAVARKNIRPSASARFPQADALIQQLAACGFAAQLGIADTPDLALLAAHCARPVLFVESATDFLAELPLEVLAADPDFQAATPAAEERRNERLGIFRLLHRWGIQTLGAFSALRREDVVARLGTAAAGMWDRASGRAERPLRLIRVPEVFVEAMELEHEVESLEPLLFILRRFLEQLATRLEAAYRVAATLSLRLSFAAGLPHDREFRIPAPTCDVNVLFSVLSTHLESLTAEAPIIAVELRATPARPERKQFSLFESGLRDPNKFFETLARLQALLGHDRVGTPVAENTCRPDAFHLETPRFDEAISPPAPAANEPPTGAALQRYRPPLPANVQEQNGRPVRVFSEKAFGEITDLRGPWHGSSDWWAERAWERIEWDVKVGDQLYRLAQQAGAWFIDGAYD